VSQEVVNDCPECGHPGLEGLCRKCGYRAILTVLTEDITSLTEENKQLRTRIKELEDKQKK